MDQELIASGEAVNRNVFSIDTSDYPETGRLRCGLPLGVSMVCGDARHREDRMPDQTVITGGARSHDVWFIRSGILRLQRHAFDGRRQILSLFLPGVIIGFEGEFRDGATVETATQSGLCRIDRRRFDLLEQDQVSRRRIIGKPAPDDHAP